ncbi:MAG: hypothetical protein FWD53_02230, partial [Phycisphaerales bacterium]|nr:hypothetical protein [Phycisphaerales bacterium]
MVQDSPSRISIPGQGDGKQGYTYYDGYGISDFYERSELIADLLAGVIREKDASGNVSEYNNFIQTNYPQGSLKKVTDVYGNVSTMIYSPAGVSGKLIGVLRTRPGSFFQEMWTYTYVSGGINDGAIETVSFKRSSDFGATWGPIVQKVTYTYHDGSDDHGNQGDLKLAVTTDGNGGVLETQYYRYYTPFTSGSGSGTVGYAHGVKYILEPESYERLKAWMTANSISDPTMVTDTQLAVFANNYFEYDSEKRVTKEVLQGAGCCGSSGQGTYTYQWSSNGNSQTYEPNVYRMKTIETFPDGQQKIVFTNSGGQVMLRVDRIYSDPSNHSSSYVDYPHFYRFDDQGRLLWKALPSAFQQVSGAYWNESKHDLLDFEAGGAGTSNSPYLKDSEGLIYRYSYGQVTGGGEVAGLNKNEYVQHGELGTPILVSGKTYTSNTDSDGHTIYPVATSTVYSNTNGTGARTTRYSYTFFNNTNAVAIRTTTMDPIPSGQNGPASSTWDLANADKVTEYYSVYGHVVWTKDGDGYITYTGYDVASGGVLRTVVDVDTNQPSDFLAGDVVPYGLTSVGGTRLRLKTDYEVDALGRSTKVTDPRGSVSYTVYKDTSHEVRTYPGWNTSTNTPTGPTVVSRKDCTGNYRETLTMTATPAVSGGKPTGAEAVANVQSLSRQIFNSSGQLVNSDRYADLTGLAYSVSLPVLSGAVKNTHYYRTEVGYDHRGRKNRAKDGVGDVARTVYDGLGRVESVWVGTNDTPTSGDWSPSNTAGTNLVKIAQNEYDNGGMGNSTLTMVTQYADSSSPRASRMYYDWRNRLVATKAGWSVGSDSGSSDGVHRPITFCDLNNLGECVVDYRYDGDGVQVTVASGVVSISATANLRAKTVNSYDDQGRIYRTEVYSVDPTNGTVSTTNVLTSNLWYDHR